MFASLQFESPSVGEFEGHFLRMDPSEKRTLEGLYREGWSLGCGLVAVIEEPDLVIRKLTRSARAAAGNGITACSSHGDLQDTSVKGQPCLADHCEVPRI